MKYFITCLFPFILLLACRHPEVQYMDGAIEEVFARAKKEDKRVFVLIGNSQCGNCDVFRKMLDSQSKTARILQKDFICYNADASNTWERDIAQITKCPSYPFPYFFDKEGNLIAFGFPQSREYDISDLEKIGVDEYLFKQLFRLPISTYEYKQLVSLNLQAYLLMKSKQKDTPVIDSAYQLVKRSLDIAVYPYNIYLSYTLAGKLSNYEPETVNRLVKPVFTPSDKLIYGNLLDTIQLKESDLAGQDKGNDSITFVFNKIKQECGFIKQGTDYAFRFEFKNTGKKDLLIAKADHPCSCIELQWPRHPIRPGETSVIKGVFHAWEKGKFLKEIYVHSVDPNVSMKIISLTGIVG